MKKNSLGIFSIIFIFSLFMGNISSVISITTSRNVSTSINDDEVTFITNTTTPIKHVVIIFQENVSFDHYFGTYPFATNPLGEPHFKADPSTPSVNWLLTDGLLTNNPNNIYPFRLDRSQAVTCDMDHEYAEEQRAYNGGLLDKFVEFAGPTDPENCTDLIHKQQVMGYYDGNTVTAIWNYAQHFALNDNSFNTVFGPSTLGALNLVSGQTHGVLPFDVHDNVVNGTVISDPDPIYDDCGESPKISMTGKNVGNLLNEKKHYMGMVSRRI